MNLLITKKEITLFTEYSLYPDITLIHLTIDVIATIVLEIPHFDCQ